MVKMLKYLLAVTQAAISGQTYHLGFRYNILMRHYELVVSFTGELEKMGDFMINISQALMKSILKK